MSSERGTANGGSGGDVYTNQADLGHQMANGYAPQHSVINGSTTSNKRGRDEDDEPRPSSRGPGLVGDIDGLKRRKTIREGSVPGPTYEASLNRSRSTITQRRR